MRNNFYIYFIPFRKHLSLKILRLYLYNSVALKYFVKVIIMIQKYKKFTIEDTVHELMYCK